MTSRNSRVLIRIAIAITFTALVLLAPRIAAGQEWRTTTTTRQTSGEELLRVNVEYGAGQLKLGSGRAGTLYRANLRYDANSFTPKFSYADSRLRLGMEGGNVRGRNLREGMLDVQLATDVPLELDLSFGAADATLDLGGLLVRRAVVRTGASRTTLSVSSPNREECELLELAVGAAKFEANGLGNLNARRLRLQGGVGEVVLDFTGTWSRDMHATVEMGLGSLTLRVPRDLGLRVARGGMLTSFDSQGLTKRGNVYFSENWDQATHKVTLDLDAALGSIRVEWVDL